MKIGNITLPRTAALAPMAGVADRAFREICCGQNACFVVGEMVSAKGLCHGSEKSSELLEVSAGERPMAVQIFGDEPYTMAKAAAMALRYNPNWIDINMGCPAPKITSGGAGSALMKNLPLAREIIRAVVRAVDIPVTVKIRKGWDDTLINAIELAGIAEQEGAAAVTVHGRTRAPMYAPPVDLDIIAPVKRAVSIPVIGNGDVVSVQTAIEMYEATNCDLIMIGRGALGAPWLFEQIRAYMEEGKNLPEPELAQRMEFLLRQVKAAVSYKGEYRAMREARSHAAWYLKGMPGAAALRREAGRLNTYQDLERLVRDVLGESDCQ